MGEIKKYDPIVIVYYKDVDGEIDTLITSKKNKSKVMSAWNNEKMVEIEGLTINTYLIQKIEEPNGSDEEFFYSLPRMVRRKIKIMCEGRNLMNFVSYVIKHHGKDYFLPVKENK